ncbi:MAG: hybrid sensor histidine kinase/response regulator [Verrucomicrobiota bacterium]
MLATDQTTLYHSPKPELANATVLVVDDDVLVHKLVKKFLTRGQIGYEGVFSAEEAFEYLEKDCPDLIYCDIMMPGMSGIEFCRRLREKERFANLPVIFSTGLTDADTLETAYQVGASDYVVKPIRDIEVISRVKHHIRAYREKMADQRAICSLNRKNESKTKFLGVASHDLRNPLVSIRGISQYLDGEQFGPLNESQKELVQTIVQASESMLTLVEDLLDISMFETGKMKVEKRLENIENLVELAATLHSVSAEKKSIKIRTRSDQIDPRLPVDKKLISRLIDNLITNAIKFSEPETQVTLTVGGDKSQLLLIVEDEGPGIPEDEFHKLFQEFGRTSNQPTAGESSSGIGLFVCKRIADAHNGSIKAENRPEGGARFTVTFKR